MEKKKETKKIPFAVLRKGAVGLAMAGMLAITPFMAGCSGAPGEKGDNGANGKSAYELAVDAGFEGTLEEWLESLKGQAGGLGSAGNGIVSVEKTGTNGLVDTYTITFTDGSTTTFTITNGEDGTPGTPGTNGATWLTGNAITGTGTEISATIANSKVGDLYFNTDTCDIYQCTAENTWNWIANIKGEKGDTGEDGISAYVGYDGYVWFGDSRTDLLHTALNEDIAENTLELYNNTYFTETKISTNNPIALMGNYLPKAKKTGYSGSKITELSIYVEDDGILEIGTASVEDIINCRTNGTILATTSTPHSVTAGKNTITLDLSVAETDTIVIGGGTSNVKVYSYQNVNGIDEFGFYTICNRELNSELLENNNLVNNKIALQIKAKGSTIQESITEEAVLTDLLTDAANTQNSWSKVTITSAPFAYDSQVVFESGTYTKVDIPVFSFSSLETEQFMTMYVVDLNYQNNNASNIVRKYKVVVPTEGFSNTSVKNWVSVDLRENAYLYNEETLQYEKCDGIVVEDNQSIAFGDASDNTLAWGYITQNYNSKYIWCGKITTAPVKISASSLVFNFYLGTSSRNTEEISFAEHLENLKSLEDEFSLKSRLEGKKLSILGDSISTYENVSDNNEYNSTLSNNAVCKYYKTGADKSVELADTYWQQLITDYDMELCVNNSWSGSFVTKSIPTNGVDSGGTLSNGMTRSMQLHNDNTNTNPDYIIVNIGINDFNAGKTCGTITDFAVIEGNGFTPSNFAESYAVMIHNIVTNYNQAEVIVFTLPDYAWNDSDSRLVQYNTVIKSIAEHYGCIVVDMFENSGINDTTSQQGNKTVDGLHPNADGFDMITSCLVDELSKYYQTNNN